MSGLKTRIVGGVVGAGMALALLCSPGVAGAAGSGGHVATSAFNCAKAPAALARINKAEARIKAGLPKLTAAEARATAKGNTTRADRIAKRIARLESPKFTSRLSKAAAHIEAVCHVDANGSPVSS
jgi:hypothetical protein